MTGKHRVIFYNQASNDRYQTGIASFDIDVCIYTVGLCANKLQ